jgi:dolichol-phosphate mannosyltransferase
MQEFSPAQTLSLRVREDFDQFDGANPENDGALIADASLPRAELPLGDVTLSIIVPTRNEAKNVEPLLTRIAQATCAIPLEVIFVDDSSDETPEVIKRVSGQFPFSVCLIARPPERRNGLGMAVVEGMRAAKHTWICVMDGDLQHPPEVIPQLLDGALDTKATLVVASRLTEGGGTEGLSLYRKLISEVLALGSRLCFPKRLREITDPLTGFFLVRRDLIDIDLLRPEGFKILLEVLVRSPHLQVAEVPFEFAKRHAGESKANSQEAIRLFRQMLRLYISAQGPLFRFVAVGVSGLFVNTVLMALFTDGLRLFYMLSALLATQGSTLWNFFFTEKWVFGERTQLHALLWQRFAGFWAVNNVLLLVRGPLLVWFVVQLEMHYLLANFISLLVMTLARYLVADGLLWRRKNLTPQPVAELSAAASNLPVSYQKEVL